MNKTALTLALSSVSLIASAQAFQNGDKIIELGIGIGAAQVNNSHYVYNKSNTPEIQSSDQTKATFTQMLGMEFGVLDFNSHSSLGVGFTINNSWGGSHHQIISGSYNYKYMVTTYGKNNRNVWMPEGSESKDRVGTGTAQAHTEIEDFNVMAKVAYHYSFSDKWDTYVAVGFGVSSYKRLYGSYSDESGFASINETLDRDYNGIKQLVYSFNDLDHVKWNGGSSQGRFVLGAYLGARYWINNNWGVHANIGITSLSFKKDYNNFNILEVGASYSF